MKKLLKIYGLSSDMQYYETIAESLINGQKKQAIEQFRAMPKNNRIQFVSAIFGNWASGLSESDKHIFISHI